MNTLRMDVLTGRHVILAGDRDLRPHAHQPEPSIDRDDDPFMEGQEHETPSETLSLRAPETLPDHPGWQVRVVPNRFPAVQPASRQNDQLLETQPVSFGLAANEKLGMLFPESPAAGQHDVVIECPDHRTSLLQLSEQETAGMLTAWALRIAQFRKGGQHAAVAVFRNEGFSAGGSLAHCHSQIVATQDLMPLQQIRLDRAALYQKQSGREIVGDLLDAELARGDRIVAVDKECVWLCPFAPRTSWHLRAVPTGDEPFCFDRLTNGQLQSLASRLHKLLRQMTSLLGPFSFNITLVQPPFCAPAAHRWMLDILPRRSRIAGWEMLTDVDIVTVSPEHSASRLRAASPALRPEITPSPSQSQTPMEWVCAGTREQDAS